MSGVAETDRSRIHSILDMRKAAELKEMQCERDGDMDGVHAWKGYAIALTWVLTMVFGVQDQHGLLREPKP